MGSRDSKIHSSDHSDPLTMANQQLRAADVNQTILRPKTVYTNNPQSLKTHIGNQRFSLSTMHLIPISNASLGHITAPHGPLGPHYYISRCIWHGSSGSFLGRRAPGEFTISYRQPTSLPKLPITIMVSVDGPSLTRSA